MWDVINRYLKIFWPHWINVDNTWALSRRSHRACVRLRICLLHLKTRRCVILIWIFSRSPRMHALRLKLWVVALSITETFDALELGAVEKLATFFETRFNVGLDFAIFLSSLVHSCILFDIVWGQLAELKCWRWTDGEDGSTHHVWNCPLSVCLRVGFLVSTYLIWIFGSKLILPNDQSTATLLVRDTCLIVGLRPSMIILITAPFSSKMQSRAPEREDLTFEERHNRHWITEDHCGEFESWFGCCCVCQVVCHAATLTALAVRVPLLGGKKNGTLRQPCPRDQEREIHPFTTCIKSNNFRFCRTVWDRSLFLTHPADENKRVTVKDTQDPTPLSPRRRVWVFKISGKIRVLKHSALLCCASHMTILLKFTRVVYYRNRTSQASATSSGPFCGRPCKFVYWPQNVWSTNTCQIQKFQDILRAYFWQFSNRSQFFFFELMVIKTWSWDFVQLLSCCSSQLAISLHAFLCMTFHSTGPCWDVCIKSHPNKVILLLLQRDPGFEHIFVIVDNFFACFAIPLSALQVDVVKEWCWFSTMDRCSVTFQPILCRPHTQTRIVRFHGLQTNIPNFGTFSQTCSKRTFTCVVVHVSKYLDILTLEFSVRSVHLPFWLRCKLILRPVLVVSICGSATGPKVATFCGSSQWSPPCERKNEGAGFWSASGVCRRGQARREQQRLCMHEIWRAGCEDDYFVRHKCYLEPREKKPRVRKCDMCVGLVQCLHSPSLTRESPPLVCETPCNWQKSKKESVSIPTPCLPPFVSWLPPRRRWACWWIRGTTSSQSVDQHVQVLHCTRRTADLFFVEFVYWVGFSASVLQLLLVVALWFWWLRRGLHVGSSDRFYFGCCVPVPNCFHVFYALLRCTRLYDLLLKFRCSMRRMLRPIQSRAVTLWKSDNFEIVPNMESYLFCLFSLSVSCVINSLSLSVPMTRAVSWTFLSQVLWNR